MAAYSMADLKAYVSAAPARATAQGIILFDLVHNLITRRFVEIPFDSDMTIENAKEKIYKLTGTKPEFMSLSYNGISLSDDTRTIKSYLPNPTITTGTLHITDSDPFSNARNGGLDDVSQVQKYVMSDEDYAKRDNTYLAYKKKMQAQDPNWKSVFQRNKQANKDGKEESTESLEQVQERIKLNDRCEVVGGRRGVISYIGYVPEIPSSTPNLVWIGVTYDEPVGKNDGSIQGHRYFSCRPRYGGFVKPAMVKTGDYPELDEMDELDRELEQDKEKEKEEKEQTSQTTQTTQTTTTTATQDKSQAVKQETTKAQQAHRRGRDEEDDEDIYAEL